MNSPVQSIPCLVCGHQLTIRLAKGRKSQKTFLMLVCTQDGRHFRGFINDREYVDKVLARLEGHSTDQRGEQDEEVNPSPPRRSKTNLERLS
jgi:hypothetical protein